MVTTDFQTCTCTCKTQRQCKGKQSANLKELRLEQDSNLRSPAYHISPAYCVCTCTCMHIRVHMYTVYSHTLELLGNGRSTVTEATARDSAVVGELVVFLLTRGNVEDWDRD